MNEKQGIDLSTSKGKGQAGGGSGFRSPMWRLLVVCLALLMGALIVSACDVATAPNDELGNGFGPYGIVHLVASEAGDELGNGFGPYGIVNMVAGEAVDEPGNGFGPYGIVNLVASEAGAVGEPFNGAGSYSHFRLTAREAGAVGEPFNGAGSYGHFRLTAREPGATAGADVFDERGVNASAWSEVEDDWFMAQSGPQLFASSAGSGASSVSCAEMQDDPVFAASSAAEAEYYEYQCSPKGAALLIDGGGSHRQ